MCNAHILQLIIMDACLVLTLTDINAFIQKYHQVNKPQLMHQANTVIFCCGQKGRKRTSSLL